MAAERPTMSESDRNGRQNAITYVSSGQKDEWADHADDLDMSLSEFIRTMVQAGRRGFLDGPDRAPVEDGPSRGSNPGGDGLETHVRHVLRSNESTTWDELVDSVTGDVEERVESVLDELQAANQVKHSPRSGGYVYMGDEDGD